MIGLLIATSVQLASRLLNGSPYHEESKDFHTGVYSLAHTNILFTVAELTHYGFLSMLWGFRFSPTPYRHTIFLTVALSSIIPTMLAFLRDAWPKLLFNPEPGQLMEMRDGVLAISHLCLGLLLLLSFLFTPRVWYPVDPYDEKGLASPEQTASLASYILSYSWIGSIVSKAFHKEINPEDLPEFPDYDRGKLWAKKIMQNQKKTTLRTLISLMRYDLGFMIISSLSIGASKFISPFAMRQLLAYIEKSQEPTVSPWFYVALLFFGPLISAWCFELYVFNSTR